MGLALCPDTCDTDIPNHPLSDDIHIDLARFDHGSGDHPGDKPFALRTMGTSSTFLPAGV